jgi:hypothetical protein
MSYYHTSANKPLPQSAGDTQLLHTSWVNFETANADLKDCNTFAGKI